MPDQTPPIGADVTALMSGAPAPSVGEDVTHLMGDGAPQMNFVVVNGQHIPLEGPLTADQLQTVYQGEGQQKADLATGAAEGLLQTLGRLGGGIVRHVPGAAAAVQALYQSPVAKALGVDWPVTPENYDQYVQDVAPSTTSEQLGALAENVGEAYLLGGPLRGAGTALTARVAPSLAPVVGSTVAGLAPRVAVEALGGAGLSAAQGGSPTAGAVLGGAAPLTEPALTAVAGWLARMANRFGRADLKIPLATLKQQPGASRLGLNDQTEKIVDFILQNRLTSPAAADRVVKDAELRLQAALTQSGRGTVATDAPQRAWQALNDLEQDVRRGIFGDTKVSDIQAAREALLNGPMGMTVQLPNGKIGRVLRPSLSATEALEAARATSKWDTTGEYGELKAVTKEAAKRAEVAARDAVKAAVPEAGPLLEQEANGITARTVLNRATWRQGNRDAVGLPAWLALAGAGPLAALGATHGPATAAMGAVVLPVAAEFLRRNQLQMGIWGTRLAEALRTQDAATAAAILQRFTQGAAPEGQRMWTGSPVRVP